MDTSGYFRRRNIQVARVPAEILEKARRVIDRLEKGQPYWQLRGKRLTDHRHSISIPLGRRWRMLAEDVDGRVRVCAILSHETYNKVI